MSVLTPTGWIGPELPMPDWHDGWVECVKLVMDRGASGEGGRPFVG